VFEASWVPVEEAFRLASDGTLRDAKTVIGLAWSRARLADDAAGKM
jgi:hypothetical protein